MSDPRYAHKFIPNRQGLCKQIIGGEICHEKEDFISHQRWEERHKDESTKSNISIGE